MLLVTDVCLGTNRKMCPDHRACLLSQEPVGENHAVLTEDAGKSRTEQIGSFTAVLLAHGCLAREWLPRGMPLPAVLKQPAQQAASPPPLRHHSPPPSPAEPALPWVLQYGGQPQERGSCCHSAAKPPADPEISRKDPCPLLPKHSDALLSLPTRQG